MSSRHPGVVGLIAAELLAPFAAAVLLAPLAAADLFSPGMAAAADKVDPSVREAERGRVATIAKLAPAVVAVFQRSTPGGGSGVLITHDGYALTNFHVVGEDHFFKCGLADGKLYDAVLVGVDPTGDVALIKLVGRDDFPIASWGDSDAVRVGDWIYVLGNPFLLASDFQPTTTYGIVSGVHRYQYPANTILEYTDCLQVDASVNPGNSGGPLFNRAGELVGINGRISIAQRGRVNAGAGYAISINQIRNFLGNLRSGRIVDHASLGATVSKDSHGAIVVSQILEESDAYRRGLRVDDEIVSFAGRPIHSVNQFKNVLGIFPDAWKISLVYRRDGDKREIRIRLRSLHAKSEIAELSAEEEPGPRRQRPPGRSPERSPVPKAPNQKEPPRRERRPIRRTPAARAAKADVSDKLKALYLRRPGFANYYFNQIERARVLRGLDAWGGDHSQKLPGWSISGSVVLGGAAGAGIAAPFECNLAANFTSLQTGGKTYLQTADQDPQDEPAHSGGLLVALAQLRLLLTERDKPFTSMIYSGTEPLDGDSELVDVLVSSLGSVETRWYFSVGTAALVGLDTRLAEDTDECEIRFREMGSFEGGSGGGGGGIRFPSEMIVRHGDGEYATFHVAKIVGKSFKDRR